MSTGYAPTRASPTASASSQNASDDILDGLDALNVATSSLSSSPALAPASLSGTFALTAGGIDDSNVKRVKIICVTNENMEQCCFGLIGVNMNSFCLKIKSTCASHSKGLKHAQSKFGPTVDNFYICKTSAGDSAWSNYTVPNKLLLNKTVFKNDLTQAQTLDEWKALFKACIEVDSSATKDEFDSVVTHMKSPIIVKDLKSAVKFKSLETDIYEYDQAFAFSTENADTEVALLSLTDADLMTVKAANIPEPLTNLVMGITTVLQKLVFQSREARSEMLRRAMLQDVSSDLTGVTAAIAGLKNTIGTTSTSSYPDVWSAVDDMEHKLHGTTFGDFENTVASHATALSQLELSSITYGRRWISLSKNWIPLLTKHESCIRKLNEDIMMLKSTGLDTRRGSLQSGLDIDTMLDNNMFSSDEVQSRHPIMDASRRFASLNLVNEKFTEIHELLTALTARFDPLSADLTTLKDKVDADIMPSEVHSSNLHQSSKGYGTTGVTYKQYFFKDEDAVKRWMQSHMTHPTHGLFVDIVSLSEFFGGDIYVERNTTLNDLYMSNKIGYATMADSIVAASFQNVLPGAYGRKSESTSTSSGTNDMSAQPELPGLSTFKKWDNQDGATGRKYWIKKEARNTQHQIDGMIRQQLSAEAQYLAKDLLGDSVTMSEELFNFISTSYQDTMHSGRFDSSQAWALTSKFVKRIFTEISDARIIARDGVHVKDPWTTGAKFVFATLRAHEVMREFMRLNIKDHPSISSEMVKFICYSQPATDTADVFARLTAGEALQRNNQGLIARMETRLKRLETQRTESDKLIKKLKEHANI